MMALNILISSSYEKVPLYVPTPTEDILMLGFEINFFFDKENYFFRKNYSVPSLLQNPSNNYGDYLLLFFFFNN